MEQALHIQHRGYIKPIISTICRLMSDAVPSAGGYIKPIISTICRYREATAWLVRAT